MKHVISHFFTAGIAALALVTLIVFGSACAGTEQQLRTGLDVAGKAIDPAYQAATAVCAAKADAVAAKLRAEGYKPAYEAESAAVTKRCDTTDQVFATIRQLHAQAVSALLGGAVDKARELYGQMLDAWAAVSGGAK